MPVSGLAYVGLAASDVGVWTQFATDILGMQDGGADSDAVRSLRLDDRLWRVRVHPSPLDDVIYVGLEADDAAAVANLAVVLEGRGTPVRSMTPADTEERNVAGGIVAKDPDGLDIEIVHGPRNADTPFRSPAGAEFVTGSMGLGHVVISAGDIGRSLAFYQALGFDISDFIETELGPGMKVRLAFLHCNARHHTLALLPVPTPKRLNHLMLEVTSVDAALAGYSRARQANVPIVRHMGRHTNDRMLSFYARTPAGFDVEYGCEGVHVGAEWQVQTYDSISLWGHEA